VKPGARHRETARRACAAALAILAAPLLMAARQQPQPGQSQQPQQTPNRRASWPCGARVDPSYFRIAEGTGGQLLLLAPEEIGDSAALITAVGAHSQTIFRSAGIVTPGLHEFQVPIDPSVESVLFSISVQCLQAADVVRPSGAVAAGDDVTDFSAFRAMHLVIVSRPEPGIWTLRVSGTGISGVVVQARSAIGIGQVEFARDRNGAFSALPSPGVENTVRIHLGGRVASVQASLVSGEFQPLSNLPLASGDTDGSYESRFTAGTAGFRLLVEGKDPEGFAFQRMTAPLLTPATADSGPVR